MVGYGTEVRDVSAKTKTLNVKMKPDLVLDEVVVKPKKENILERTIRQWK